VRLAAAFAFAAMLAAPAFAQVAPRTDIAAMMKEAKADPAIKAALAETSRSTDAILRDTSRSTPLILKAAGAKPGMRVLDIGSGGGYLALLFSTLVGPTGHVDIHNTPGWIAQFPGMDPDAQKSRTKQTNVGWITTPWGNDLPGEAGSYDIVMLGQVYHDVILEGGDFMGMNRKYFELLKPGGRVVVEDHDAIDTQPLGQQVGLHRVSHEETIAQFEASGFKLIDLILIESSYDDRRFNVFRPGVRGRTDRFIATFEKPAA
jgi:predicted methyltransferase